MEHHLREYVYDTNDNICKITSSIFNHHSDTPISVRSSVYCVEVERTAHLQASSRLVFISGGIR